ncbi:helix-turn-helix transcriptional regulator [Kribbella sp. VKM Ac-2568]|uniref:helix-turn-helix transcriptional regulator n=1 Tax=Kribbella sp. VKM Ac-2568 TaxID=2512219 RepID=UPI00104812FF|nr:helix-turn-helix transcriptional regulator [Kribbella sp. VKM Ac-2568]TCM37889.1 helix-turn-helix protein [Kribbella sp. VKM Ac-2568]
MDLRGDVQQFLTGMRARLTPEEAGVPMFGGERRVPGLRREEVAQLSGVSTAYYTRMERGNLRGVSESVLRSLARTLQMNEPETQHLFDLARAASEGARTPRVEPQRRLPQRAAQLIEAMPDVPAIALGRLADPVGSNALGRALFPHLFPANAEPLNHTRYLFLDNRSREFYVDWERDARHVVSALRLFAGQDPSDRALMALVGELATHSPEFRTWWAGHTVRVHAAGTKAIRHPVVGELTVAYETLTLGSAPDVRIVTYLADPDTPSADALDLLRSWSATTIASAEPEHSAPSSPARGQTAPGAAPPRDP